ncbi:MAG: FAD-dependent oxidoreductase [Candidatus Hodarchaeota archaeon]
MSFELLKNEVIDAGLCQGCGKCAGSCKHIEMDKLRPKLKDYCILERQGIDCGRCYEGCPQVTQNKFKAHQPKAIYSLRSKDPEILKRATNGGFITTIAKRLLEQEKVKNIVMVQNNDDKPEADEVSNPDDVVQKAGIVYGRSGVLEKLNKLMGETLDPVGIVGVACEMRGAAEIEEKMKKDILKLGLFCNSSIRTELTDRGLVCSPCCNGCPSGVNAQGYIAHIRNGEYQKAVDLIREKNPLPSICGRICTHECEHGCTFIGTDHPVAIRELKKFVTEWEMEKGEKKTAKPKPQGKKVAIIGSGPAGLTAAYYLAKQGYAPTIFEKSEQAGGMLRFGVPQFRLPNYVLDYDIKSIKNAGVEIQYNKPFGPEMTIEDLKKDGFKAVFIATGQYKPRTLRLEGEDLPNVHVAIEFLIDRKYRYCENMEEFQGKTIGIIGGGPVAVDVAQTALRLGAEKIHLVDIASEKDLELVLRDIPENEYELMQYHFTTSTSKITKGNGEKLVLNCYNIEWEDPNENGKRALNKVKNSDYEIPVDAIVIAVGQAVDFDLIDAATDNELEKARNKITVNETTFETNIPGVFAGGDIIENSKAVAIAAIAHGKEAAISIDRYLKGEDLSKGRYRQSRMFFSGPKKPPKDFSLKACLEEEEETWSFENEIDAMFNEDLALKEARRCLSCNQYCAHCQDFPAIYSDITAGEVGSKRGFTTVVVWTDKGKEIVDKAIEDGLFVQGEVDEEELKKAIKIKSKRELLDFEKPARKAILDYVEKQGISTITNISENLKIAPKKVRYEALRLVQQHKLDMKIEPNKEEPLFSIMCE